MAHIPGFSNSFRSDDRKNNYAKFSNYQGQEFYLRFTNIAEPIIFAYTTVHFGRFRKGSNEIVA
jgi:hypothetical protein